MGPPHLGKTGIRRGWRKGLRTKGWETPLCVTEGRAESETVGPTRGPSLLSAPSRRSALGSSPEGGAWRGPCVHHLDSPMMAPISPRLGHLRGGQFRVLPKCGALHIRHVAKTGDEYERARLPPDPPPTRGPLPLSSAWLKPKLRGAPSSFTGSPVRALGSGVTSCNREGG